MIKSRITMEDIAAEAGVAVSTVCRALSGKARISGKTQERIRAVAEKLGYRPDPLISALVSRRHGTPSHATTIAYITNFPSENRWREHSFYYGLFEGAVARAEQLGYRVEHFWLKAQGMTGARLSRILYHRGISCVCVAPMPQVRGHLPLEWRRFSGVSIGYTMLRPGLHRATCHHFQGISLAIRELKKLGYKRIGFCSCEATSKRVDNLWLAGCLVNRMFDNSTSVSAFFWNNRKPSEFFKWCRQEKLEVVIGAEPEVKALLEAEKLQVDYVSCCWSQDEPQIAGIDQRPRVIGAAAIDMVIAQFQRGERGVPEVPLTVQVEGGWRPGTSLSRYRPDGT